MSDNDVSDVESNASVIEISDDVQQLWKEALEQCKQVEQIYAAVLHDTVQLQQSLSVEIDDNIIVMYQGIQQDLMEILDAIHAISVEQADIDLSSRLLQMLDSCEFKTSA